MTLPTTVSRVSYAGAGSVGPFAFPFRVLAAADLLVTKQAVTGTESTLGYIGDFSATGIADASGTITLSVPLAVGEKLTIRRGPAVTQPTSIRNQGPYFASTVEDALDRLTMQTQSLQDQIARSIGVTESYDPATVTLRIKPETGKVLGWDVGGVLTNKTLDSSAVALPGGGRTVATLSAFLANNAVANIADFGGVGDNVHDDYAAGVLAHDSLPTTGGIIVFPPTTANKWYFSQRWSITKPLFMSGQLVTQSTTVAPTGTVLEFAADQSGIQFEGDTTLGDTLVASRGYGANFSVLERIGVRSRGGKTGLLAGGTGVAVHAFRIRAPNVTLRHFWGQDFHGDAVRIWASTGSVDPTLKGNANVWHLDHGWISNCSGDGISTNGTDVNAGLASIVSISLMGGRGVWDRSFLGNTYIAINTFSNTTRSYEVTGATNTSILLGCYSEYTGEPKALINFPALVVGGVLSGDGAIDPASTAIIFNGSGALRGAIQHINKRGAVQIGASLGQDTNGQRAFSWGSSDDIASLDGMDLEYDDTTGRWSIRHHASAARILIEWPGLGTSAPRVWTSQFRNGILFGSAGDTGIWLTLTTGSPGAIAFNRGDVAWENLPGINKPHFYRCTVAGSPGTQVPGPVIDVFSGDRGDTSVTLAFPTDCRHQRFNTPLTVARSVTLPAAAASLTGVSFLIVREAGATGAFNLDIKNSAGTTLVSLTAAKQWALMLCDGATFRQMEAGTQF